VTKPLVSILIPAYNSEKWLRECIESALGQTCSRKEVIVVDDGSKDATLEIARSYASPIVQVLTQENRGASAARNYALSRSQGDYIQWLDADDVLAPDKVALQLQETQPGESSCTLLTCSWGRFFHRPEDSFFRSDALWQDLEPREWLYLKVKHNLWMAIESWLVSRELSDKAGPWDERMSLDDDGEYFCRVLSHARAIRFVPEARCFCRSAANPGVSSNWALSPRKLESLSLSVHAHIGTLRSMEDSPRVREACLDLLRRLSIDFYPERQDLFGRLQSLAVDLGGELPPPQLRAKYRWLQGLFGWRVAKRAQYALPQIRSFVKFHLGRLFSPFGAW
jgi:glycosyltransferase involved in cell wall biosynthesis